MEKKMESSESKVSETKSVLQEFGEKISQAMELEKQKMREKAEEEAKQIIARAKEEADRCIIQAKQESEKEADRFYTEIKEKAEQILKESRDKSIAEAIQESDRILNETREKTAQIISDVVESGIVQVKKELSRAASEAKNKLEGETSQLLTVTKNIGQIIDETQSNIQAGIDRLVNIITETGNQIQILNDTARTENVTQEPQAVEEIIEIKHVETVNQVITEDLPQVTGKSGETEPVTKQEKQEIAVSQIQAAAKAGIESMEKIEERKTPYVAREQVKSVVMEAEKPEISGDVDTLMRRGIALLDEEKTPEALAVFQNIIETDPNNALAWRKMGTALGMLGRHMEALKALRKATSLTPRDITAWHNTEIILRKLGQKKEAKEAKEMEKQLIKQYPEQYKEIVKKVSEI